MYVRGDDLRLPYPLMHRIHAFGITAASRSDHARLGRELGRLGYAEVWANDTRRGDGIRTLVELSTGTSALHLAVGVIALSEYSPARVAERVQASGLGAERLTLGVGSGSSASLGLVRDGVVELRRLLPAHTIAVAAVGPRMLHLAGEVADAVVTNWTLPDRLSLQRERIVAGAYSAGRPTPRLVSYVRTAIGRGAEERIRAEMERYRRYGGGHYARAFDEQPGALIGVAVDSGDAAELRAALEPYRAVADTLVVRGLPSDDSVDGWLEIAAAASAG